MGVHSQYLEIHVKPCKQDEIYTPEIAFFKFILPESNLMYELISNSYVRSDHFSSECGPYFGQYMYNVLKILFKGFPYSYRVHFYISSDVNIDDGFC